jgi:two-component system sensor histidine kinase TctE
MSLRRFLLVGILVPVGLLVVANSMALYQQALAAADTAYDRTLLASAKAIGELLEVAAVDGRPQLRSTLPYSALEAFEADNRSRMFFRVSGFGGEMVSGFDDLPPPRPGPDKAGVYAALVHFYSDVYQGEGVRMAVLLQPVSGAGGQGMATIQVAETLELRRTLARQLLASTLWQQGLFVALVAAVVVLVVQRATKPVRALSQRLQERPETDLQPLPTTGVPRELQPMVEASNQLMQRLALLLDHQKRFVRDASHQLRTPLAVLKTQLQSARRGDVAPAQALSEMTVTVARATELANQLLALAKVEQLRQQGTEADTPVTAWDRVLREVALDVSPLIAAAQLDFEITTVPAAVRAHAWALRELARNLLHNAVKFSPTGGRLRVRLEPAGPGVARLTVADSGPGIGAAQRERLFQPFAAGHGQAEAAVTASGSGLGLAICEGIVRSLGGHIALLNRADGTGLDASVELPVLDDDGASGTDDSAGQ